MYTCMCYIHTCYYEALARGCRNLKYDACGMCMCYTCRVYAMVGYAN